jgi:hypothetical protein
MRLQRNSNVLSKDPRITKSLFSNANLWINDARKRHHKELTFEGFITWSPPPGSPSHTGPPQSSGEEAAHDNPRSIKEILFLLSLRRSPRCSTSPPLFAVSELRGIYHVLHCSASGGAEEDVPGLPHLQSTRAWLPPENVFQLLCGRPLPSLTALNSTGGLRQFLFGGPLSVQLGSRPLPGLRTLTWTPPTRS